LAGPSAHEDSGSAALTDADLFFHNVLLAKGSELRVKTGKRLKINGTASSDWEFLLTFLPSYLPGLPTSFFRRLFSEI
jgi:hypothetical protein